MFKLASFVAPPSLSLNDFIMKDDCCFSVSDPYRTQYITNPECYLFANQLIDASEEGKPVGLAL